MQRNQRSNCQHPLDHQKIKLVSEKTSTSALLSMQKLLTMWITTNWKIVQEMGIPDHLTCLMRNLCAGQKQQLELSMKQQTGSKLGKEYVKDVYCHTVYLDHMQNTSCEMLDWMNHKLGSRLPGEMSIISDTQMIPPLWQKPKRN